MDLPSPSPQTPSGNGRTSSFSFLRRTSSRELLGGRKSSGGTLTRIQQAEVEQQEETRRQEPTAPRLPPRLPSFLPQPELQTFGGENYEPPMAEDTRDASKVLSPMSGSSDKQVTDSNGRTESMTNRGRYSYANSTTSTLNSPRRVRRRKDPTPYK